MNDTLYAIRSLLVNKHKTTVLVFSGTEDEMFQKYEPLLDYYVRSTTADVARLRLVHVPTHPRFTKLISRDEMERLVLDWGHFVCVFDQTRTVGENWTCFPMKLDYAAVERRMEQHYRYGPRAAERLQEAMSRVTNGGPLIPATPYSGSVTGRFTSKKPPVELRERNPCGEVPCGSHAHPLASPLVTDLSLASAKPVERQPKALRCECGAASAGTTHAAYCPLRK